MPTQRGRMADARTQPRPGISWRLATYAVGMRLQCAARRHPTRVHAGMPPTRTHAQNPLPAHLPRARPFGPVGTRAATRPRSEIHLSHLVKSRPSSHAFDIGACEGRPAAAGAHLTTMDAQITHPRRFSGDRRPPRAASFRNHRNVHPRFHPRLFRPGVGAARRVVLCAPCTAHHARAGRVARRCWPLSLSGAAGSARAASCAPAASAGTAPADWGTYCWLDFSSYNDALARGGGQPFTFTLPDGSTLSFVATVTAAPRPRPQGVAAPSWTGAAVGNTAFLGIPGKPILYTANAGNVTDHLLRDLPHPATGDHRRLDLLVRRRRR